MFLARATLRPDLKFSSSLASFLRFVLTSPHNSEKFLSLFDSRRIKRVKAGWFSPHDIMARLAAMFHAAFCESKLLARGGYQTLTKSTHTHWNDCVHIHLNVYACSVSNICFYHSFVYMFLIFFFPVRLNYSLFHRWDSWLTEESQCRFLEGDINKKRLAS